jgi:Na+-translocating ferredoxin:NAD+ oxidoreductase RnfG subunit
MNVLAIVISSLALIFSAYTYFKHDKKIKQQSRLLNQYNLEKIEKEKEEEKKAKIEAFVVKEYKGTRTIKIYNKGKSIAKSVNVIIPKNDGYEVINNPCPIDIKPQKGIEVMLILSTNYPDKIEIGFEWKDDFNEKNIDSQMIQL